MKTSLQVLGRDELDVDVLGEGGEGDLQTTDTLPDLLLQVADLGPLLVILQVGRESLGLSRVKLHHHRGPCHLPETRHRH